MKLKKIISTVLVSVLVLVSVGFTVPAFAKGFDFSFNFVKYSEVIKIVDFKFDNNLQKKIEKLFKKHKVVPKKKNDKKNEFKLPVFKFPILKFPIEMPVEGPVVEEPVVEEPVVEDPVEPEAPPTIPDPFEEEEPEPEEEALDTASNYVWHHNIITTTFWLGEKASADNGWISNESTAYESPADSVNDWYVAVPLSDITTKDGQTMNKDWVVDLPWYDPADSEGYEYYSYLKNRWVMIRRGDKVAYGQVADAGPRGEDLYNYVILGGEFHNPLSQNNAGLDVSPAINDYLGMDGKDEADWKFIEEEEVPDGPWKEHIETQQCVWGEWGDVH